MSRPTRKSIEERKIFGRADRAETTTPIVSVKALPIPESIDTPEKEKLWVFLTSDLAKRGLLAESYTWSIEMLINNKFLLDQYRANLEETGPLMPTFSRDGNTITGYIENPIFSMLKRVESTVIKLMEKLGLTPRDIVYLNNPDAKIQIEGVVSEERKKVSYFR
jgi:hypothetical protein